MRQHIVQKKVGNADVDQRTGFESTYTENLALFYLGLQAKYLVPASTVTETASEMKNL